MLVSLWDLNVPFDFIFTKWLEWSRPRETIEEFCTQPIVLHKGFEFLLLGEFLCKK